MPKATLLQKGTDYTVFMGNSSIKFEGGIEQEVSVAVALRVKKIERHKKLLFEVTNIPELVVPDKVVQKKARQEPSGVQTDLF